MFIGIIYVLSLATQIEQKFIGGLQEYKTYNSTVFATVFHASSYCIIHFLRNVSFEKHN